ncbi:MAG TPA: tetratricopeptide repeat protein [Pyrinomonadaceae bacterium]|nr:tetratricopeptide repeat protein [Pyrinomonadaceae bacterium]
MFLPTGRAAARRYFIRVLPLVFLLAASFSQASAQNGIESIGTGGKHRIQGRIFFPSGRRSDAPTIKVSLESTSSERLSVIADLNGSFTFQNLAAGSYSLSVDAGQDYEIARESVTIEGFGIRSRTIPPAELARANVPRTFSVIVNLRLKQGAAEKRPGVVNAALANLPKPAVELYDKGVAAAQAGDAKKAVEHLRAAVAHYPEFSLALNELGVQYLRLNQPDKAVEALRAALRIKPDEFMPRLNYGIALLEKKDVAEAEVELRAALRKNEASWPAHMYLGIALISLRKYDEAEKEMRRALALSGEKLSLPHYYLGGIYWKNKDYKRAADELEIYLKLAPKAADAERVRATVKELREKQH